METPDEVNDDIIEYFRGIESQYIGVLEEDANGYFEGEFSGVNSFLN